MTAPGRRRCLRKARAEAGLPEPGEDRFSYMAFAYVGDTDEEGLRIGQKIAWFLTVSIKSAPQFLKFSGCRRSRDGPRSVAQRCVETPAADQSRRGGAGRPGPNVRRQPRHGGAADQGIPASGRRCRPHHHDDPARAGDPRRGGKELYPRRQGGVAAIAYLEPLDQDETAWEARRAAASAAK